MNKEKSKIGIKKSNRKYIEDSEKFDSNGKYHMRTKIIMQEKKAPENGFPTKNKKTR